MITAIRFRAEGEHVVLQVCDGINMLFSKDEDWRDAKVTDLLEVSAYTHTTLSNRVAKLEESLDGVIDKVWGEE